MLLTRRLSCIFVAILSLALISAVQAADLSLGGMFTDHAVIQRDKPIAVWGKADPASQLVITLGNEKAMAIANDQGDFRVDLPAMKAGGPYELTVTSGGAAGKTITVSDILIGDVWICSGQSNMQMSVRQSSNAQQEIAAANYPNMRIFRVGNNPSLKPVDEVKGTWRQVSPQTIPGFSAVGYFFGRELHQTLNIPIGLIDNSWGGMPAESYTTRATLEADPDLKPMVERLDFAMAHYDEQMAEYQKQLEAFNKEHPQAEAGTMTDPGNKGVEKGWAKADFDDAAWKTMKLPNAWEQLGLNIDGAVWFRKVVTLPDAWAGKELMLSIGQIDDFDTAYFDGQQVGDTHAAANESWQIQRNYKIPAAISAGAGKHLIAVRVFDHMGGGGIYSGPLELTCDIPGAKPIDLTGDWKYQIEVSRVQPGPNGHAPRAPEGDKSPRNPAALWLGMTEPISPYAITGVIWYQGETNAGRSYQYRKLLPAMINDWRKVWGKDTTFLIVQLANYMKEQTDPGERSGWAELREAQNMALALPLTGIATAIDVGDAKDIHPKDKQTVGHRLALDALAITYGKDVVFQGPTYDSIKIEGNTPGTPGSIRVNFKHTDGGLKVKGDKITGFAIAGEDQKWYWADAAIDGNSVIVKSADVPNPVAVRYGWANNPPVSVYNGHDLPMLPFRSDDWPGVTINNK